METAGETLHGKEAPEYYENSIWPALVAFATGLAAVGFFFLMKRMVLVAGFLMVLASAVILGGFLFSDTRNWASSISKLGRIPRDTLVGSFPVDINLTIQIIIMTELLLFGGAFGMYFAVREQFVTWPPPGTPILDDFVARVLTLILISSSILVEWAIWQLKQGKMKAFKAGLIGTTILGAMFPILQFGVEWPHLLLNNILTSATNFFGATFYLLTGIHGAHVLVGVIAYCYTDIRAMMGQYSPKNHGFVEATSTYWHFVHIIWLFLFALMWQGSRV
jgi:heme/copper-type cytochrome/quinol oxidase subunit 3